MKFNPIYLCITSLMVGTSQAMPMTASRRLVGSGASEGSGLETNDAVLAGTQRLSEIMPQDHGLHQGAISKKKRQQSPDTTMSVGGGSGSTMGGGGFGGGGAPSSFHNRRDDGSILGEITQEIGIAGRDSMPRQQQQQK